jgi:4-hydroxy-2-oxoheptanedioate aldolase
VLKAGESLRAALAGDGPVTGTFLYYCADPRWAPVLARVGLDFAIIDNEHTPFSRRETADMIAALASWGIAPLVRIPSPSPEHVHTALDAGAHGIVAPYCETPAQVRAVVEAARLRPLKGRAITNALHPRNPARRRIRQFVDDHNRNVVVVIGVESAPAVRALDRMLAVGGVDLVHVGTQDLSVSLGCPLDLAAPPMTRTLAAIARTCARRKVPATIFPLPLDQCLAWVRRGMRVVLCSNDRQALLDGYRADLAKLARARRRG